MKRTLAIILAVMMLLTMVGCNYTMFDVNYDFDYALVKMPDGSVEKIEIQSWTDYEGEQLQIVDADGTVYLVCSTNCVFVKEGENP